MANIKISELNPLLTVEDADVLPIVDNAVTKKVTAAILRSYTEGNSVLLTGAQTIAGIKTFTSQLASSVATGTAPFSVASTTKVTNLNADLLDGLSSADFQATLSGTGIVKSTAGTISYLTDNSSNWNTAFNDSIVSAAVTGTTTKLLTLNQQDGGTITASWSDIDTAPVTSVFGRTGAIVATSGDYTTTQVTEGTNLYFTDARARAAISLTTTGTSGVATYVSGVLNIPNYGSALSAYVPYTGATTNVNLGTHSLTASDLVINHASGSGVAASITKGGAGEALTVVKSSGSGNAASITGGTTLISELNLTTDLADAYIASAATWNAKQNAITLTTTGTSGAATLVGATLNIPQYQSVLTNPITGTGTTNYLPKFTGASALGNSLLQEGTNVIGVGVTPTAWGSGYSSLQVSNTSLFGSSALDLNLASNMYLDNVGYKYISSGYATLYNQYQGKHFWSTAGSGTAGDAISFTQAMTLDASGNLGLGTTTPARTLHILGQAGIGTVLKLEGASGTTTYLQLAYNGATNAQSGYISYDSSANMGFFTNDAQKAVITAGGNVGIGTTSPNRTLSINGIIGVSSGTANTQQLLLSVDAAASYITSSYFGSSSYVPMFLEAGGGVRMSIQTNGNIGIGTTTDAGYKLDVNGTARVSGNFVLNSAASTITKVFADDNVSFRGYVIGAGIADTTEYAYIKYQPQSGQLVIAGSPSGFGGNIVFKNNETTWLSVNSANSAIFSNSIRFASFTTTQINALPASAGTTVFNTTLGTICFYDGSAWKQVVNIAM